MICLHLVALEMIRECLNLSKIGFEPSLGKGHAFVRFGRHQLLLTRTEGQPLVKAQLFVNCESGGALKVLDRLRLLLPHALRHFPNLRCSLLLPLRDGCHVHHDHLALFAAGKKPVFLDNKELTRAEITVLLQPWLEVWLDSDRPHVFISYLWGLLDCATADSLLTHSQHKRSTANRFLSSKTSIG
jgi:hypothetical protein